MDIGQVLRRATNRVMGPLALALGLALTACGGGGGASGSDTTPAPVSQPAGTVSGRVLSSASGAGLSGVKVSAGTRSTTSGSDGSYTLSQVPVGNTTAVAFELGGYATGFATVAVTDGATTAATPRLVPVSATQSFAAASAATVSVAGSTAQVSLPAAGLVDKRSGAAASGTVSAEVTVIDPASDPASMPGNYTASTATGTQTIESFGALSVNLRDAAGNALNLAAGQRATIRIPVSTRSATVPATMPLYYFNESTGLWVQEGTATLGGTAPNQYYEGTVAHFSVWNADQPSDTIRVFGCVVDGNGAPVANLDVSTIGLDYSGTGHGLTDAQGKFSAPMRKGGIASVFAEQGTRATNVRQAGPSQTDIQLTPCLVLGSTAQAPTLVQQPQSQTVQSGTFVVFQSRAVGSGVLRYQWTRNGMAVAGANLSSLVLFPVTDADNGAVYRVMVTGDAGSVTSDPATLTVQSTPLAPLILTQPQATQAVVGATATFSVSAQSQGGTLAYQWRRNGVDVAGATGASYTTPAVAAGDNGAVYSVRVSSSNGTSTLSADAGLTVVAALVAPTITVQPVNISVGVGQAASFSVTAAGSPTLLYQWKRNGTDITGANGVSYTTAATVLADSGAVYSVVVSNGAGSVTSANATLTVTPAVGQGGYYLVSVAGPSVGGTVPYANGTQSVGSPALVAVSTSNPTQTPVTLMPAGQGAPLGVPVFEATVRGGLVSNLRSRYTVFVQGSRFYVVDQVVAGSNVPMPQLLSDLATTSVCGASGSPVEDFSVEGYDLADASRSWLFVHAPGADGQCGTADDTVRALRVNMSGTTPSLDLGTALPVAGIRTSTGAFGGLLVRNGTQVQQLNADLGGASNLFSVSASFASGPVVLAGSAPGVWFHTDAGKLYAVDLSAPGTRRELATLQAGEVLGVDIVGSNGEYFVPLNGSTGTRVLRVSSTLTATALATYSQLVNGLLATDAQLIAEMTTGAPQTVPRSGGTPTPLLTLALGEQVVSVHAGASTVAMGVSSINLTTGAATTRVVLLNGDGSNVQNIANAALLGGVAGNAMAIDQTLNRSYAIYVADNVTSLANDAGATVRAVALDTRATLVTYGTLPATPAGLLFPYIAGPFQYSQPGLFGFAGSSTAAIDLYYFKSDVAGLTRVTNFITAGGSASPAALRRVGGRR